MSKLVPAHFSRNELDVLDHLQGGREQNKRLGVRSYSGLEDLLQNPHIKKRLRDHASDEDSIMELHQAKRGLPRAAELESLKRHGRDGDTEIALIGPHLRSLLDHMAGHRTHNPHDGHPEYSVLDSLFSMFGSLFGAGKSLFPSVGNAEKAVTGSSAVRAAADWYNKRNRDNINNWQKQQNYTNSNNLEKFVRPGDLDSFKVSRPVNPVIRPPQRTAFSTFPEPHGIGDVVGGLDSAYSQGKKHYDTLYGPTKSTDTINLRNSPMRLLKYILPHIMGPAMKYFQVPEQTALGLAGRKAQEGLTGEKQPHPDLVSNFKFNNGRDPNEAESQAMIEKEKMANANNRSNYRPRTDEEQEANNAFVLQKRQEALGRLKARNAGSASVSEDPYRQALQKQNAMIG